MFDKVLAHTSFIGNTGYNSHSRNFFTQLNKLIPVKIRNFSVGDSWEDLFDTPHNGESYLTDEHKNMLSSQTLFDADKIRTDFFIYGGSDKDKEDSVNIILNETNHYYFYDNYEGIKIAYNVWESTEYPTGFFNKLLEYDQLWVPTNWHKNCCIKQGYPKNKIKIVHEGVDKDVFYPEDIKKEDLLDEYKDGRFKFLLFGRWDYRKSITEIIRTFLDTFQEDEPVDLIISVDNPFSVDGIKIAEERLSHYELEDKRIKIKHFPSREEYIKYLKTGHVFVSCARSEGWNLPLIEAMACGIPTIASNWGAQLEFCKDISHLVNILEERPANIGKDLSFVGDIPGNYCEPDFEHLGKIMRNVYENYEEYRKEAFKNSGIIRFKFSWEKAARQAYNYLQEIKYCKKEKELSIIHHSEAFDFIKKGTFEEKIYEKYFKVEERDIVVDIGAQVGLFSLTLIDRNIEKCYCIEPEEINFEDLSKNIINSGKSKEFVFIKKAIDLKTGYKYYKKGKGFGIYEKADGYCDAIKVETISFMDFIKEYNIKKIDFLKLDCEGAEYYILDEEKNLKFIEKNVKKIAAEIHLSKNNKRKDGLQLIENLKKIGFKVIINSVDGVDITKSFEKNVDYYTEILIYASKDSLFDKKLLVKDGQNIHKNNIELYQDQYVNGEVLIKGKRDCEERYKAIKTVFDQYKRQFTILDIGANFGYYSIRAADEYDAISVMVESKKEEVNKLIEIADKNNCRSNLIILNTMLNLYKLEEIVKCEHFDIVLALNIIHHFNNKDIKKICEMFMKLGDNLIIETPPVGDKGSCGQENLKPILDFFGEKEKIKLGSFKRHTSDKKSDIFWIKTSKKELTSTYYEYDTLFWNKTIDKKFVHLLKKEPMQIFSNDERKTIYNNRHGKIRNWIHGINLFTFIKLNGIYPYGEDIIKKLISRDIITGYNWDDTNEDIVLHNFILKGHELHLIDYDDPGLNPEEEFYTDSSQINRVRKQLDVIFVQKKEIESDLGVKIDFNLSKGVSCDEDKKYITNSRFNEVRITNNFIGNPFVEIKGGDLNQEYLVEFLDQEKNKIIWSDKIKPGNWTRCNRQWYTDWRVKISNKEKVIFDKEIDLRNKRVLISLESSSLGDTIAWFPYVEEFRKKHNCKMIVSTFWNNLFEKEYPDIIFVSPSIVIHNIVASYTIGWFMPVEQNKNPNDFRTIPLQRTASDILGLESKEIRPKIVIPNKPRNIEEKYICIAIHATCQAKYWNNPEGWQQVVNVLRESGYKVVLISREQGVYMGNSPPKGIIDKTGDISIEERIIDLKYADLFIGIGSGLSWLAWAVGTPVILISGFSSPLFECKKGVIRVYNSLVCNSCFNDPSFEFDKGNWNWCPRNNNFICTKTIIPVAITRSINTSLKLAKESKEGLSVFADIANFLYPDG